MLNCTDPLYFFTPLASSFTHHNHGICRVCECVHQAAACVCEFLQSMSPVCSLSEEALLHALFLSLYDL